MNKQLAQIQGYSYDFHSYTTVLSTLAYVERASVERVAAFLENASESQ